jgi:signal peptidase II
MFLATAIIGTVVDLLSKYLVFPEYSYAICFFSERIEIIPPIFGIQYSWNPGAVFGIGQNLGPLFIVLSIAAAVLIPLVYIRLASTAGWWQAFGLGAIEAGALGNLYDRLRYGPVRDFLHFHFGRFSWPTFNIADALICVGLAALFLGSMVGAGGKQRPAPRASGSDASP